VTKAPSPLLGYNNNVRHRNRMFHVQTEDSGVKHPHIITHLFMDGGRILKSVKQSYAEHVGADGMAEIVRNMMKDQHKAMLIALRDGQFDHLVDPKAKPPAAPPAPPVDASAGAQNAPADGVARPPPEAAAPRPPSQPAAAPAPAARAPSQRPPALQGATQPSPAPTHAHAAAPPAPPTPGAAPQRSASVRPPPVRPQSARPPSPSVRPAAPSQRPPSGASASSRPQPSGDDAPATTRTPAGGQELTLDIDALERAAKDAEGASPMFPSNDLPPPPQNLFRDKQVHGQYRAVTPPPSEQPSSGATARRPPSQAPPRKGSNAAVPRQAPNRAPPVRPADGRYAPARPAAIFGQARPQPQNAPPSLFGEDLISDKSLDEVILSYLAEDLEPSEKKKR
jgi:hypothetical protein